MDTYHLLRDFLYPFMQSSMASSSLPVPSHPPSCISSQKAGGSTFSIVSPFFVHPVPLHSRSALLIFCHLKRFRHLLVSAVKVQKVKIPARQKFLPLLTPPYDDSSIVELQNSKKRKQAEN